jgi:uncharacterized protein (TIGR02444 family)
MSSVDTIPSAPPSPFWAFSLGYYRMAGVAEACLHLQDHCGADVNVVLFLLWTATQKRRLKTDAVQTLTDTVRAWHGDVVVPIRNLRRMLKSNPSLLDKGSVAVFRNKIKAVELESERLQQEAMFALAPRLPFETVNSVDEAAQANIAAYQSVTGRPLEATAVNTLLTALGQRASGEKK